MMIKKKKKNEKNENKNKEKEDLISDDFEFNNKIDLRDNNKKENEEKIFLSMI